MLHMLSIGLLFVDILLAIGQSQREVLRSSKLSKVHDKLSSSPYKKLLPESQNRFLEIICLVCDCDCAVVSAGAWCPL